MYGNQGKRKCWRCVTMEINEIGKLIMFSLPNKTMNKDKIKIHC